MVYWTAATRVFCLVGKKVDSKAAKMVCWMADQLVGAKVE